MSTKSTFNFSLDLTAVLEQLAETAGLLWQRGWAEANGGNISVNVSEHLSDIDTVDFPYQPLGVPCPELGGQVFASSSTFTRMRDLARDWRNFVCIVRIDDDGKGYHLVWGGENQDKRPTSEFNTHLMLHREMQKKDPALKAVLHTHADELIALSHYPEFADENHLNDRLLSISPEMVYYLHEGVAHVPYERTGTVELGIATAKRVADHSVFLWEKHGVVAIGPDVAWAFDLVDVANKAAKIALLFMSTGAQPDGLSNQQIQDLRDQWFN